jgi:hypothetical protein
MRTSVAIRLAIAFGIPAGIFLYASAGPFGPVLFGWLVALAGAVLVTGAIGAFTTGRYVAIGLGYAAGVAVSASIAGLETPRQVGHDWWALPAQFAIVFTIVGSMSFIGSGLCTVLKWEDKKARGKGR